MSRANGVKHDLNKNKTAEAIGGVMQPYGYTATYDDEDRLASWTRDDSNLTQGWNLSPVGDWTSFIENTITQTRTHGPTHELTAIDSAPLTYDAQGNLTTNSNGQTYTWDFDSRMTSATVPAGSPGIEGSHTYGYDALGRRVSKTVDGDTTVFVSRTEPIRHGPMDGHVVAYYSQGAPGSSPNQSIIYGTYVDGATYRVNSSTIGAYYHANGQHSVAALSDDSQGVLQRYAYGAYGKAGFVDAQGAEQASQPSGIDNWITFTGREYDEESARYYFRARYYDPVVGGFLSRDPIGYVVGPSLYVPYFVHRGGVDPTGKYWDWDYCQGTGSPYSCDPSPDDLVGDEIAAYNLCDTLDYSQCPNGCTKAKCQEAMLQFIDAVRDTWILHVPIVGWPIGPNTCSRWARTCCVNASGISDNPCVSRATVCLKKECRNGGLTNVHYWFRIGLCGQTGICADNGALGGDDDHIFCPPGER